MIRLTTLFESNVMNRPMRTCCVLLAALALVGGPALADDLEVDFNSDTFRGAYTIAREAKGLEFDFAWLHGSGDEDSDVVSAGMHLRGLAGTRNHPLEAGVGGKLLAFDTTADSGAAVALGGYLRYKLKRLERLSFTAEAYYAPDVLSFSGAESYFEGGLRAAYDIHERASVYLGWRNLNVDFDDSASADVADGVHVGLRFAF